MNEIQEKVLFCLRDPSPDAVQDLLTQLTDKQWGELVNTARKQGLAPLLYSRLQQLGVSVPPTVNGSLQAAFHNNAARNFNLLHEHEKLIEALDAHKIPVITLKGIYLAACIYPNIGERVMNDIDLLVPSDDLSRAVQVIELGGYRSRRKYDFEHEKQLNHHLPPYFKTKASMLEIHWNILPARSRYRIDLDGIWDRSLPVKIGESEARTLCPEDLLLHLCAHTAYHLYRDGPRSLYDIKIVLTHFETQLDWRIVSTRAREWGLVNSVYLTLRLACSLLEHDLPAHVWQTLHPGVFDEELINAAKMKIFREQTLSHRLTSVWKGETLDKRLLGAWKRLALPPKILAGKYNLPPESKRVHLYYLIRAKDLFMLHSRNLVSLLLGRKQESDILSNDGSLIDFLDWHPDPHDIADR